MADLAATSEAAASGSGRELAERRRLRDGPWRRWAWAVGANAPMIGVPVLLLHAISRRSLTPMLLASLLSLPALVAQSALLLVGGLAVIQRLEDPAQLGPALLAAVQAHLPAYGWLSLASMLLGILGHKLGQDRDLAASRRRLSLASAGSADTAVPRFRGGEAARGPAAER
ncbi:MAG: hypothetical protein RLZZ624_438 [Cyanobacteriota bacterium]|jgi:hypothetical protein